MRARATHFPVVGKRPSLDGDLKIACGVCGKTGYPNGPWMDQHRGWHVLCRCGVWVSQKGWWSHARARHAHEEGTMREWLRDRLVAG